MPIDSSCQAESKSKVFNKKNHYQIERDGDVKMMKNIKKMKEQQKKKEKKKKKYRMKKQRMNKIMI